MTIDDLRQSISEMPRQDALAVILSIRANRRISKKPAPVAKVKKDVKVGQMPLDDIVKGFSKDELSKLMEILGGVKNEG